MAIKKKKKLEGAELANAQARAQGQKYYAGGKEVSRSDYKTITGHGGMKTPAVEAYQKHEEELKEKQRMEEIKETATRYVDIDVAKKKILQERAEALQTQMPKETPETETGFRGEEQLMKGEEEKAPLLQRIKETSPLNIPEAKLLAMGAVATPGAIVGGLPSATTTAKKVAEIGDEAIEGLLKGSKLTMKLKKADPAKFATAREQLVNKIFFRSGFTRDQARTAVNTYVKMSVPEITQMYNKAFKMGKVALKYGTILATTDVLLTAWLGSDNILTGSSFWINPIMDLLEEGEITKQQALERMENVQGWRDIATSFITWSTRYNLLLRPWRKIIMANAEGTQQVFDDKKLLIENY